MVFWNAQKKKYTTIASMSVLILDVFGTKFNLLPNVLQWIDKPIVGQISALVIAAILGVVGIIWMINKEFI